MHSITKCEYCLTHLYPPVPNTQTWHLRTLQDAALAHPDIRNAQHADVQQATGTAVTVKKATLAKTPMAGMG